MEPWQEELLRRARVGRLATIAHDGEPHLVPVCYALIGDAIAIAIDEKPKSTTTGLARLRNIARDPRVTLLVDHYEDGDWTKLAWVRIHGTAEVLDTGSAWPAALAALRDRYSQYRTMSLEELPLIRITPGRIASWRWTPE